MGNTNTVLQAISDRRSIRGYKPEQISGGELSALLKAALESPSANNAQPWHFTVVQNPKLLDEINAEVVKNLEGVSDIFYGAPTVIFISSDPESRWGRIDSGIAVQTIALAAQGLGLGSVILGLPDFAFAGDKREHFTVALKFPQGQTFAVAIAVGYPTTTKEAHPNEPDRIDHVI
ncbi:MAG: nitroreductase [Coriobacteriales bacterium]|jgi:nitroreductase|nr:nitroreductase [Coriobacteriales bacterium]